MSDERIRMLIARFNKINEYKLEDGLNYVFSTVSAKCGKDIKADYCWTYSDFLDKLNNNPNYNIILIHLGFNTVEDGFKLADKCREISGAYLVAESSSFDSDKERVLAHFDHYMDFFHDYDNKRNFNLEIMLRESGFIPANPNP
jgi:hypothetical protein